MYHVAGANLLPMLVALLIGFVTGMWIWKFARKVAAREPILTEEPTMRRPYVDNRPAVEPLPASELRSAGPRAEPEVLARRTPPPPAYVDDNDVVSGPAAAVEDVADQFLGIDAHPAPFDPAGDASAAGDDLQAMKGVGPKLAALLRAEGITRYEQIAALEPADLVRLDAHLGAFKGRLVRDRIVEQAAFLAARDRAGYEQAFGKL